MHRQNITRLLIGKENKVNFIAKLKKIGKKKELKQLPKEEQKIIKKDVKQQKKQQKVIEREREIG